VMGSDPDDSPFDLLYEDVLGIIEDFSGRDVNGDERLQDICNLLKRSVPHYDWVGFYLIDPENKRELVLGPFAGEPTEHVRIRLGRGICGQAAEREETLLVQDVNEETNYLSCSPFVRSEIVVPIFKDAKILGELDIDSHAISPFTDSDRKFLENVCLAVADIM